MKIRVLFEEHIVEPQCPHRMAKRKRATLTKGPTTVRRKACGWPRCSGSPNQEGSMVSDTEPRRKRRRAGLQALTTFYQQPRAAGPRLGEGYFRLILD